MRGRHLKCITANKCLNFRERVEVVRKNGDVLHPSAVLRIANVREKTQMEEKNKKKFLRHCVAALKKRTEKMDLHFCLIETKHEVVKTSSCLASCRWSLAIHSITIMKQDKSVFPPHAFTCCYSFCHCFHWFFLRTFVSSPKTIRKSQIHFYLFTPIDNTAKHNFFVHCKVVWQVFTQISLRTSGF